MATLTIKPTSVGNDIQIKSGSGGTTHATFGDTSTVTLDTATITNATITAGTFPAGHMVKFERSISTAPTIQDASDTHTDVTGSSVSYTPATGASYVYYKTKFLVTGDYSSAFMIAHFKIVHDGSDISNSRFYLDAREGTSGHFSYGMKSMEQVLPAWTGAKTTSTKFRRYGSTYGFKLHDLYLWDGSNPHYSASVETIMYSIM